MTSYDDNEPTLLGGSVPNEGISTSKLFRGSITFKCWRGKSKVWVSTVAISLQDTILSSEKKKN